MSIHVKITLGKITMGPRGARIGLLIYRQLPDGTQEPLEMNGGREAAVHAVREGESITINLATEEEKGK